MRSVWLACVLLAGCGGGYHPQGFKKAALHGLEAKLAGDTCINCHGADLTGSGEVPGCDTCHIEGWRTDCVRCHGGDLEGSGAPPRDLSGVDEGVNSRFAAHTVHVLGTASSRPVPCEECHAVPTDVMTPGHVFVDDTTPGVAEVDFTGPASGTLWNGTTCTSNCHGARTRADPVDHRDALSCGGCHAVTGNGNVGNLGGRHSLHQRERVSCDACHQGIAADGVTITAPDHHNDGVIDVSMPGITFQNNTCTGRCHGRGHNYRW